VEESAVQRFTIATVYPRLFQLGSIAIPTAGVFTALAIIVALFTARVTARRLDLNPEKTWDLGIVGVLTGFFAPRLILIFTNWKDFIAHPLWLISVVRVRSEVAMIGGLAVATLIVAAFIFFTRMPFRPTLDALAPSLALGFAIASIGAFAGGSNFGTPTNLPWAVTYTSRFASLWNGAPLGTPLHPVQIYAVLAELCILALLLAMIAKREKLKICNGEIMGAWLFLHGVCAFSLNFLRGDITAANFILPQSLAATMVVAGGLLWLL
jgi:phosphatidylglycerol:prolipoprotein diacylglycerol transferase